MQTRIGNQHLLVIGLFFSMVCGAQAKKQQEVTAVPFAAITKIQIAPEIAKISPYIRIRNLLNGRTLELPLEGKDSIDKKSVEPLVSDLVEKVMLEFSLYYLEKRSQEAVRGQLFDGTRDTAPVLSPRKYQPAQAFWRRVGYTMEFDGPNQYRILIRSGVRTIFLSERDAQKRREAVELKDSRKVFDEAWKDLHRKRYDLALNAFNALLATPNVLNQSQITQAYFGRGLSKFHQMGCDAAEEDFDKAIKNPDNADDISYYRGLCKVEKKDFKAALPIFSGLVKSKNKVYQDAAKFYEGLCLEMTEKEEEAYEIYLDTVDFSADPTIVALAKARLDYLDAERKRGWKPSWLLVGFSVGAGYDTNVIGLPPGVAPSGGITSEASPTILLAPLVNAFYSLKPGVIQSWRYTFADIFYTNSSLQDTYGLMSHDLATVLFIAANERNNHTLTASGNSITLGGFKNAEEYMRIYTFDYIWNRLAGEEGKEPNISWTYGAKAQMQYPQQEAASTTTDLEAIGYQLSLSRMKKEDALRATGFSLRAEYKPAKGSENSVMDAGVSYIWHRPMFYWRKLKLEQSFDFDYYNYWQSSTDRVDYSGKYNVGVSKNIIENMLDARLQLMYQMNFSTVSESYRYNKFTVNLSLSGSF